MSTKDATKGRQQRTSPGWRRWPPAPLNKGRHLAGDVGHQRAAVSVVELEEVALPQPAVVTRRAPQPHGAGRRVQLRAVVRRPGRSWAGRESVKLSPCKQTIFKK